MKKMLFVSGLAVFCFSAVPSYAQTPDTDAEAPAEEAPTDETGEAEPESGAEGASEDDDSEESEESEETEGEEGAEPAEGAAGEEGAEEPKPAEPKPEEPKPEEPEEPEEPAPTEETEEAEGFEPASPIADLAAEDDSEFVPLEDIEEGALDQIIPADVFPYLEWHGYFRLRTEVGVNYDLDTRGTSAILPPLETLGSNPADEDADSLWSTNLRLRLDPTIHITDELRVHVEADILDNLVLGESPRRILPDDGVTPDVTSPFNTGTQFSPRDSIRFNEVYGEISTIFGTLSVGRMDSHWGLGIFENDGDCLDCDFGTHIDRAIFGTRVFGIDGAASIDFPDEGLVSEPPSRLAGQPYDLGQVDDADQYTFYVSVSPKRPEDIQLQRKRLFDDDAVVINWGGFFRFRDQDGQFVQPSVAAVPDFPNSVPTLAYTGLNAFTTDAWVQFLYAPDFDTYVRVELEGLGTFGSIDNVSGEPVGQATESEDAVNCFEAGAAEERCVTDANDNSLSRDFTQIGLALESELRFGETVSWGFNGGFATGGDTPNWGTTGQFPDLDFYRFNPDYHVDLILFRRVIGTVTNAAYYNPYARAEFLKSGRRHMEFQLDSIFSHALDSAGTPSGSTLLGLEFDAALRYVLVDTFSATLEGGILFPFDGLAAEQGRPRYQTFDSNGPDFTNSVDPSLAWTVQGKFGWTF